jgi:hypothetical protein
MANNRISNRFELTNSGAGLRNPPQRAVVPTPIVYTAIATPFAQPPPTGTVSAWNGVITSQGRESINTNTVITSTRSGA